MKLFIEFAIGTTVIAAALVWFRLKLGPIVYDRRHPEDENGTLTASEDVFYINSDGIWKVTGDGQRIKVSTNYDQIERESEWRR